VSATRRTVRRAGAVGATLAGLALCVAVAVWALARPDADPVTAAMTHAVSTVREALDPLLPVRTEPDPDWTRLALEVADGDPHLGKTLIAEYGCGACHTIPGIPRAHGSVGPDLAGLRDQAYIAGVLPNRPGDLVRWLENPPRHSPETAMPDMGVSEAQAEHMAAYLYTLGRD